MKQFKLKASSSTGKLTLANSMVKAGPPGTYHIHSVPDEVTALEVILAMEQVGFLRFTAAWDELIPGAILK